MWEIKQAADDVIELYIYGDVEDGKFDFETFTVKKSENSAEHFREELRKYPNAKRINLYINSYGGSVFEGTAIYNQLKRHPAEKVVYIDGFACSIASVIAMAGDKVVMPKSAMMMIHNAWMVAIGDSTELRKAADDLDQINKGNRQAYLEKATNLTEEKLVELLNAETWLTAEDCMAIGFADEYTDKEIDTAEAEAALQKMATNLTQRIQINKSLAAQLRSIEADAPVDEKQPEIPAEESISTPEEPAENKVLRLFAGRRAGRSEQE